MAIEGFGSITWYKYSGDFVAVCKCHPAKPGCRRHKTPHRGSRPAQGLALGYLACWLLHARNYPDQRQHKQDFACTKADRQAAREQLRGLPNGEALLRKEDRREDDPDEPVDEP